MTKISIYQIDEYVTADDKWIGTDVNTYNKTKNFTPRKLATYFNGSQVINTGVDLLYKYFTITPPEDRPAGTLSFETEIGATVDFSNINTFLLSKTTLKGNDVSEFLDFLVNSTSLIYKAKNINIFGSYKIVSVETYFLDPNFFVVNVDFLEGNGFIEEDEDYMISVVDLDKTIPIPQLVKETFDYESSNTFTLANEINNVLQVIVNTTSLHPEAYSYTLPSTVTVINELFAGDVITVVYNYLEEFLEVPDLQRVINVGNHTTKDIVVDNLPGEYGSYTVTNTLNDLGTFQSYTSPTDTDYQSVYAAYEMSINEIYSPTENLEMYIGQGIIQTSYSDGSDNTAARLYSGDSVNGASLYIEKNDVNGQLKIDDLTDNITLQFPDKPTGTYTIATTSDVIPFNPAEYDLDEFSNAGTDPFAHVSDIPAPLGYVPVNKAGDTMLGILTLSEDPIEPLDAVTKQYVDRIEEHTYAEYVALINDNALLPERYYALTDYQHKYYIEETNTSPKKVFGAVSDISVDYWIIGSNYQYDLNVGMTVTITSLPLGYTGTLQVGQTTTVTEAYANYYFRFANGMNYQYDAVGVGLSWSYTRYVTNTSLNNATVYDTHGKIEMKPGGVLNTDVHDGTAYGNLTAAQNFTPPIEKIILRAKSINSFYQSCASLTFLNDEMIYDFNDNIVYNDNEEQIGTRNGFISRRFNKVLEIDIDKDWRVQRYRRWLVPPATVESDYRKKLINQDYPNTNIYLAFQNKYLFTSEFMTTSSVDNMYICTSPEYSTLTAGETGSTVSYPITVTGSTGGVGSTEDIVNFKDYTIFELDSNLNPVEISRCEINQFKNSVFINTDATNKNDLNISINSSINDSTFFGYPYIVGKTTSLTKINAFDRIVIYGDYSTFQNINFLGFGEIISNTDYYKNLIFGSLPYFVFFSGMGPTSPESGTGTGVRWYVTISSTSSLQNCLIGVGYSTFTILNSKISGGSIFNYATKATILGIVEPSYLIVNTELTNANYHNYYAQNLTTNNTSLTSKLIKISQSLLTTGVLEVILQSDVNSALYYQNLDIATFANTVTKKYNYTTYLFETVPNPGAGTISGTTNTLTKFTSASAIGNSSITDNGTIVTTVTDLSLNGIRIGRGLGNVASNVVFGINCLNTSTTGGNNIVFGTNSLTSNIVGGANIALGASTLESNNANHNIGIGNNALQFNSLGIYNIAIGSQAGRYQSNGSSSVTSATNSIFIGAISKALGNTQTNQIVIGVGATGAGSNTVTIGDNSIASTILKGLITAPLTTNALIEADTTGKAVVTKEYVNNRLVVETTSGYTLTNADSGGIIIFKTTAAQTLTIPTGLADGFECTFVTLAGVTLTVTSTGNTLNNAIGNVLPSQSSFTLKRMIAANTFIATGNI